MVSECARHYVQTHRLTHSSKKLQAVREAVRHEFPTGDVETMLEEIERGYVKVK